jgi:hypothetical protein
MDMFSHESPLRGRKIHYGNSPDVTTGRSACRETDAQPADAAARFATSFRPLPRGR